jgi:hypothetical protein
VGIGIGLKKKVFRKEAADDQSFQHEEDILRDL